MSVDAILSVEDGASVHAGDVLARIPRESSKTRDITGGLPRVAELFEARRPKDHAIIAEASGRVEYGKDYKAKRRSSSIPTRTVRRRPSTCSQGQAHHRPGRRPRRSGRPSDGRQPVPHDILKVLGVAALANYLVTEIQEVYRLQGVTINDKHIEVICRQMLQRSRSTIPARRPSWSASRSTAASSTRSTPRPRPRGAYRRRPSRCSRASPRPRSRPDRSFPRRRSRRPRGCSPRRPSPGGVDRLGGLKENVIVGRLIPGGTGNLMARLRAVAARRDRELEEQAEREKEEAEAAAAIAEAEAEAEGQEEARIA